MTYSINKDLGYIIQQDSEGKQEIKDISLKDFFEQAQSLGFFPEGRNFDAVYCDVTFDFYGEEKTVVRTYQSMLEADCFGTEDLQEIIASFFESFPEKLYWIKANNVEVLHRTPRRECDGKDWRLYATTTGTEKHLHRGFIETEWSEYQTNQKLALEMLLKQLEGQVVFVKNQIENL